jgi:uncharacterized OsmC-like protein
MTKALKSRGDRAERRRVSATWVYGSAYDVDLGERALRADAGRDRGGTGSGPDPDQLLRASLATSLLMAYRACAERLGVEVQGARLELEVDMTRRASGSLLQPRWRRIHGRIHLQSQASELELWRVIELAHSEASVLVSLSPAIARSFALLHDHAQGSV